MVWKLSVIGMVAATLALAAVTGCKKSDDTAAGGGSGDDDEKTLRAVIDKTKAKAAILKTVQDVPTATAAAPKVKAIDQELQSLLKGLDTKKMPKEREQALKAKFQKEMGEASADLGREMMRISNMTALLEVPDVLNALMGLTVTPGGGK